MYSTAHRYVHFQKKKKKKNLFISKMIRISDYDFYRVKLKVEVTSYTTYV